MSSSLSTRRQDAAESVERLMDAAEKLTALHPGAGVSDRAIVVESGHRNNSAVTYHFGTRDALTLAVWRRRTRLVGDRRAAMLADLDRPVAELDRRTAWELYIRPIAEEIAAGRPSYWARFNERMLQQRPLNFLGQVRPSLGQDADPQIVTLLDVFDRLCSSAAPTVREVAEIRVALAMRFVTASLAAWERAADAGEVQAEALTAYVDELVAMTDGMLTAGCG